MRSQSIYRVTEETAAVATPGKTMRYVCRIKDRKRARACANKDEGNFAKR